MAKKNRVEPRSEEERNERTGETRRKRQDKIEERGEKKEDRRESMGRCGAVLGLSGASLGSCWSWKSLGRVLVPLRGSLGAFLGPLGTLLGPLGSLLGLLGVL